MTRDRQFTVSLYLYALATLILVVFNLIVPPDWISSKLFHMTNVIP